MLKNVLISCKIKYFCVIPTCSVHECRACMNAVLHDSRIFSHISRSVVLSYTHSEKCDFIRSSCVEVVADFYKQKHM